MTKIEKEYLKFLKKQEMNYQKHFSFEELKRTT